MAGGAWRAARPLLGLGALSVPLPLLVDRKKLRARGGLVRNEGLDSSTFVRLKCLRNEAATHNVRKITLQLPHGEVRWTALLPIANVVVGATFQEEGAQTPKQLARPYNPLAVDEPGSLTILVKKYEGAKLGGELHALSVGQSIDVKGGWQQWTFEADRYSHYGMVAGGTGITPLMQALSYIMEHDPEAKVTLLSANRTPQDVLLHAELSALQKAYPKRLTVHYHVDSAAGTQVTQELLKKVMPPAAPRTLIMVCGPMGMVGAVAGPKAKDFTQGEVGGFLKELGYSSVHVWKV